MGRVFVHSNFEFQVLFSKEMYEWNARTQVTLWGENSTQVLFDYACKAWSGLVEEYVQNLYLGVKFFQAINVSSP